MATRWPRDAVCRAALDRGLNGRKQLLAKSGQGLGALLAVIHYLVTLAWFHPENRSPLDQRQSVADMSAILDVIPLGFHIGSEATPSMAGCFQGQAPRARTWQQKQTGSPCGEARWSSTVKK